MTGAAIGGISDISKSDFDSLQVQDIKKIDWNTSIDLILSDSSNIKGEYMGFVGGDSGAAMGDVMFPNPGEIIDLYYFKEPHRKYYFKSLYYRVRTEGLIPVFRLSTKFEEINQNALECNYLIRANGDMLSIESIISSMNDNYFDKLILLRNSEKLTTIQIRDIVSVKIIRTYDGLKKGLKYGFLLDVVWYTILYLALRNANFE